MVILVLQIFRQLLHHMCPKSFCSLLSFASVHIDSVKVAIGTISQLTTAVVGELVAVVVLFTLFHYSTFLSKSKMTPLVLTREDVMHVAFRSDTSVSAQLGFAESVMSGCLTRMP